MSPAEENAVRTSARNGWLLSLPALVVLFLAALGPLMIVVVYSFLSPGQYGGIEWKYSLDGWTGVLFERDIFEDTLKLADGNLTIFWRSVQLSLLTTLLTFLVGFPTAWFIVTRPAKARAAWLFLITIPFWTNLLIRTFAINQIIRNEGILNTALIKLGIISAPLQITYTDTAVLIGMVYVYLPLMVLPLFAAIDRFDMRLLEAGYDLYASRWQVLRKIILPIVSPGIVASSSGLGDSATASKTSRSRLPRPLPISMIGFFFASRAISMSVLKAMCVSQGANCAICDVIPGGTR